MDCLVCKNSMARLFEYNILFISYLENWNSKWDASGTEGLSFMETDIDYINHE